MPNTLAHLGAQSLVLGPLAGKSARGLLPLVWLGCVLPDLPWILQRALAVAVPVLDPYDLRLYAANQASLALCLLLSAAVALPLARPAVALAVLGAGSLLHLLLDAAQTKWGNGVQLLVPFDFRVTNFGWFWPESATTLVITATGLVALGWWPRVARESGALWAESSRRPGRWIVSAALLALYLTAPALLVPMAERADVHSVRTLRQPGERAGRTVELHKAHFFPAGHVRGAPGVDAPHVLDVGSRPIRLEGYDAPEPQRISIRGRFVGEETVRVDAVHRHAAGLRDAASYVGLTAIAAALVLGISRRSSRAPRAS